MWTPIFSKGDGSQFSWWGPICCLINTFGKSSFCAAISKACFGYSTNDFSVVMASSSWWRMSSNHQLCCVEKRSRPVKCTESISFHVYWQHFNWRHNRHLDFICSEGNKHCRCFCVQLNSFSHSRYQTKRTDQFGSQWNCFCFWYRSNLEWRGCYRQQPTYCSLQSLPWWLLRKHTRTSIRYRSQCAHQSLHS